MKNKTSIKIYNLIFPIWIIWLFPITWIVVLPANFIIDSLVILITLMVLKINDKKTIYKKAIFKAWIFGFLSDFIGTVIMIIPSLIFSKLPKNISMWIDKNLISPLAYNPFSSIYSALWGILAVLVAGYFIYLFNYKVTLKNIDIEIRSKKILAISLAVFTAPYLFFIPMI
ncbi:MAG: hypothetical protein E6248_06100 [Clostridium sp.]|uniref:hypothetical protein n=1 Tax=Clostridium sp. TaxID=1506 RepID=UPI00290C02B6|nr:hypothetical protein [Clostridium sp.]MDU5109999.1 hypothetical protein [Clostridium sp.]